MIEVEYQEEPDTVQGNFINPKKSLSQPFFFNINYCYYNNNLRDINISLSLSFYTFIKPKVVF